MTSPTARTLAAFRSLGFTSRVVERFCPFSKRRVDLFEIGDVLAVCEGVGVLLVQATSGTNHAARRTKALAEPRLREWLASGGRFEIVSWTKAGARGKRKTWQMRREEIVLEQLGTE